MPGYYASSGKMIPYITQPSFRIGSFTVYAFGAAVACGLLFGYWITVRRAVIRGVDPIRARCISVGVASSAVIGSAILSIVFFRIPGIYSFGGIYVGLVSAYFLSRWLLPGRQRMVLVDALSFAFPCGWIFGRLGCTLAHDHPGLASDAWYAVQYPGGPRLDLGLIEFVFTCLLVAMLVYLDRRPRPDGFFLGVFLLAYGPFRMLLERVRENGSDVHQVFAAVTLSLGVWVLLRVAPQGRAAEERKRLLC